MCLDHLVWIHRIHIQLPLTERNPISSADPSLRPLRFIFLQVLFHRRQRMLHTILLAPRFILEAAGHSARLRRSRRLLVGRRDRWYRSRTSERLLLPFDLFWGHPERSFLADLRKGLLFVFFPAVRTRRIQLLQNRQQ